jgi:hypothetical protein
VNNSAGTVAILAELTRQQLVFPELDDDLAVVFAGLQDAPGLVPVRDPILLAPAGLVF